MKYKNKETGVIIEVQSELAGAWELVKAASKKAPAKKKPTPKKEEK